jgi:iron complex outermembrane receptor protein
MSNRVKTAVSKLGKMHGIVLSTLTLAAAMEIAVADEVAVDMDIPAQSLSGTLDDLAKLTHTKLIYSDDMVDGLNASALHGKLTVQQALTQILADNGLQFETVGEGMIAVKTRSRKNAEVRDDSIFELGMMTVSDQEHNGSLTSRDIATSVDVMYADKIQDQNVLTAYDLFHRMPGVQITQFGQGTTTGKLSFRGFNGEGRVNAVKLLIDGIPSNTNDGNMPFIDALFPLDIESMEVVRGTNDPRYGLHNIAGNVNINTTTGGNYAKGRLSYGSFNTHEIQSGFGYEKDGFAQNYQISYRASDGYRDHSDSDKNSFSGKWSFTPNDNKFKTGLSVRWSEADAEEPGYLTYEEKSDSRTQSFDRNDTDGSQRQIGQVSAFFDANLTDDLFWSTKAYANTFNDERFVKFDACCQQVERQRNESQYGAMTSLTYRPVITWLNDFSLEVGFDFQQQDNEYQQYRTIERVRTRPGANPFDPARYTRNNEEWDFLNYGGYIQAVIKPTSWLKITPGYRADAIDSDGLIIKPPVGNAGKYRVNDYGMIHQPKIGMVITPMDGYSLYGNWGRTFQIGLGSSTFLTPGVVNSEPSINEGWEVGVKLNPVDWAEARIAYWAQNATNELSRNLGSTDSTAVGATKRQGIDIQAKVSPMDTLSIWAAYSLQEAKVRKAPPYVQYQSEYQVGNQIVNTPNYLFTAGIDYQVTPQLRSSLWTSGQGSFFVDQANEKGKYGEYALLNLDLGYQLTKNVEVQFQAKNLTDEKRDYLWYDETYGTLARPLFSPADGRAFFGAVNVRFDY